MLALTARPVKYSWIVAPFLVVVPSSPSSPSGTNGADSVNTGSLVSGTVIHHPAHKSTRFSMILLGDKISIYFGNHRAPNHGKNLVIPKSCNIVVAKV